MTSVGAPAGPGGTFASAWHEGNRRVYVLSLLGAAAFRSHTSGRWSKLVMRLLVVAAFPGILNLFLLANAPELAAHGIKAFFWLAAFGVVNAIMLSAALAAWSYADRNSSRIDAMLPNAADRSAVADEVRKCYDWRKQAVPPVLLSIAAIPFLLLVADSMRPLVDVGLPSYVSLVLSMAIGANDLYWLYNTTPLMIFFLKRPGLRLRWYDPASTPGMKLLADICGLSAVFLLLGAAAVSILGFILPQVTNVPSLLWTLIVFFFLDLVVIVWSSIVPIIFVYRTASAVISRSLTTLHGYIPSASTYASSPTEERTALIDTYHSVSKSLRLPFTTGTIVQYGAALLSTIIAFMLSLT